MGPNITLLHIIDKWIENHSVLRESYKCDLDSDYPAIYAKQYHGYDVVLVHEIKCILRGWTHVNVGYREISAADPKFFTKLEQYLVDYLQYIKNGYGYEVL